jgi:hypothetical protein
MTVKPPKKSSSKKSSKLRKAAGNLSFATDIKPLFSSIDQDHMTFMFDLSSYDDVKSNAGAIYDAVSNKRMPPPPPDGDGPWPQSKIDTFKQWMDEGSPP